MTKDEVKKILGISKIDNVISDNALALCNLKPLTGTNLYDVEEVCRVYAKAVTFYKQYLPEYYVEKLLNIDIHHLQNMNLEYVAMPSEMQVLFYDFYPEGSFKYSKYVYNAAYVYKMQSVFSKAIFLKIPSDFAIHYRNRFISAKSAVSMLGFSKINADLYHYYLL